MLKLLSYNIRFGGHEREHLLASVIRAVSPDIVVFQEATTPHIIERLARETGLPLWAAQYGRSIAYISRVEIAHHAWHHPLGSKHAFMEIQPAGSEFRIFGLHLSAIFSKWSERRRAGEVRAILESIKQHQEGLHVLVGDFNTLAPGELLEVRRMPGWIQALIWISGRDIQRETIQLILDAGYADGFRTLHPDERGSTFPVWDPHLRLDYVFLPRRRADCLKGCRVLHDLPDVPQASDHYPLLSLVELDVPLRQVAGTV